MCKKVQGTANINGDTGLQSAGMIAHEIGHKWVIFSMSRLTVWCSYLIQMMFQPFYSHQFVLNFQLTLDDYYL